MTLAELSESLLQLADADSRKRAACHPEWLRWTVCAIAHILKKSSPEWCIDNSHLFCVSVIMELQAAQRQGVIPLSEEINATWMRFSHGMTYAAVRWLCDVGHRDGALIEGLASEALLILRPISQSE